jgi:hypothetical protein
MKVSALRGAGFLRGHGGDMSNAIDQLIGSASACKYFKSWL